MKTQHTQGEWFANIGEINSLIYSETDGKSIACTYSGAMEREESEANARLIAAAPELLKVLYLVVMDFENEDGFINPDTIQATREAIQKATQP